MLAGVFDCPISLVFPEEVSMPPDQIKKWKQLISSAENLFNEETTGVIGVVLYQSLYYYRARYEEYFIQH